eukprot:jgi/Botrbrau1/15504/Bobra.43_2s0121.1
MLSFFFGVLVTTRGVGARLEPSSDDEHHLAGNNEDLQSASYPIDPQVETVTVAEGRSIGLDVMSGGARGRELLRAGLLGFDAASFLWQWTASVEEKVEVHLEGPPVADVFSALRDPAAEEVRLIVGCRSEVYCRNVISCRYELFSESAKTSSAVSGMVPATQIFVHPQCGRKVDYTMLVVSCPYNISGTGPKREVAAKYNAVSLIDNIGLPMHKPMGVEEIKVVPPQYRGVDICVGPIYSQHPQFLNWFEHMMGHNVSAVHAYATMYTREVWERKRFGQPYRPPDLYMLSKLHWRVYVPYEDAHYHSQYWLYNDCLFRHRQSADFLLFIDADEFLHFRGREVPDLHSWLANVVPPHSVGVCGRIPETEGYGSVPCRRLMYRPMNVPLEEQQLQRAGYEGVQYTPLNINISSVLPDPVYRGTCDASTLQGIVRKGGKACHTKCAVRPTGVLVYHVHYPWPGYLEPGWEGPDLLPREELLIIHQRCIQGKHWGAGHTDVAARLKESTSHLG